MALVVNDRVKETSTTTGTGTFTLDGAVTGFETFSSAIGNSNTTYYAIEIPNSTEFEVGLGTVAAGTLARTTVISSSNSDALVDFSAGTKNVFCTLPASKAVIEDASNNVTLPADLTVDTDTLYVDSSNNRVGIGGIPTERLTVIGTNNTSASELKVKDTDGRGILIESPYSGSGVGFIGTDGTNSALGFKVNGTELARFGTNGYLGIGTTSPSTLLHLSSSDPQITITDTDGTGSQVIKAVGDDLEIISENHLKLDADTGLFVFRDTGSHVFSIHNQNNAINFKSEISDTDLIFKGNDGGSEITALTLDMSDSGFAEFNSKIRVEADTSANAILVKGRSADDIGTIKFTANDGSGNQGELSARSNVFILNTPTKTNFRINNTDKLVLTSSQVNLKDTVFVDANEQIQFGDAGETISGDGTNLTIASSNNTTIDSVGSIFLDADNNGLVDFKDGGTTYLRVSEVGNNAILKSFISDGNFIIKGNDGGVDTTALTLDMSEAGAATFNSSVTVGANLDVSSGTIKLDGNFPAGSNNVALGNDALSAGAGLNNTMIGNDTGSSITSGQDNTGVGDRALRDVTTGIQNTGLGKEALLNVEDGSYNVAVGHQSLLSNVSGNTNTAVGYTSLQNATNQRNTAVGYGTGNSVTSGSNLTLLGYNAESSSATATNEITLGDNNVTSLRIPGLQSGASSGDVLTYDGTDITLSAPTGVSAGFSIAMAIAL
jgi:hypothetical protein